MSLDEAISYLKLSIEFGADEALMETPRDRFNEKSSKDASLEDNYKKEAQGDAKIVGKNHSIEKSFSPREKYLQAITSAGKCLSIFEIETSLSLIFFFKFNNLGFIILKISETSFLVIPCS